jgi:hypothetical protein
MTMHMPSREAAGKARDPAFWAKLVSVCVFFCYLFIIQPARGVLFSRGKKGYMATERRWIEGRTELDETRDGPSRKKNGGDEFGRTTKTNDPTKKTKWRGKRERDILYGRERARPGRPVVVGGRQNSPSQVRPDSQNMTGTLSVLFFPPSFFSPPSFSFSVSFPPTLPACRDGTNRPKVMDSPPALGLGCRMRWYIPPSTRCVERIVYSSVSFASSVVIFFLSSVLLWALRIVLYRFGI